MNTTTPDVIVTAAREVYGPFSFQQLSTALSRTWDTIAEDTLACGPAMTRRGASEFAADYVYMHGHGDSLVAKAMARELSRVDARQFAKIAKAALPAARYSR